MAGRGRVYPGDAANGSADAGATRDTPEAHQGSGLRKLLTGPSVFGSYHDEEHQRLLIAAPGVRISTGNRRIVIGCLVSLVFVPAWLVWGLVITTRAGDGMLDTAVQMRAWGWPGAVLLVALFVVGALKPVISEPQRLMRNLLRGKVIALRPTAVATALAERAGSATAGAFERAAVLATVQGWRTQAANLSKLAGWISGGEADDVDTAAQAAGRSGTVEASARGVVDPVVDPAEIRRVAGELRRAADDQSTLVLQWCRSAHSATDLPAATAPAGAVGAASRRIVLRETFVNDAGDEDERWAIAAPGEMITELPQLRYRYWARGAGLGALAGLIFGSSRWAESTSIWLGWALIPIGLLLGWLWGRFLVPRVSRLGRQLRTGRAVRLRSSRLNRAIAQLAAHGGPLYWELAQQAAARDELVQRLQAADLPSAGRTVLRTEIDTTNKTLYIGLSRVALGQAIRSLQDTESGVDAYGLVNAGLYLSVQQGRAAALDADS